MSAHESETVQTGSVHGLDAYIVTTPVATAAISAFGGQLLSFRPNTTDQDVLWVSPQLAAIPTPIRGGVPLCWPYFGREGQAPDAPSHGYARTATWTLSRHEVTAAGEVEVELQPQGLEHLGLELTQTLRVGKTLTQTLHTRNPATEPLPLTEAFHNYFRVSDVMDVTVTGLAGRKYLDKLDDMNTHTQQGDWVLPANDPRCDRVYPDSAVPHSIIDPGLDRIIQLTSSGSATTVVWNPGETAARAMPDVGESSRGFVCVETANAGSNVVTVPPGETTVMQQSISVAPLPH